MLASLNKFRRVAFQSFTAAFSVGRNRQLFFEQLLRGIDSALPIQTLEKFVPPAAVERGQSYRAASAFARLPELPDRARLV